jgi:alkanesulfonate monooxygenase SsuD/methylene tetrahydromethanopterin reductase-like flavin-dependent oxidoreductase (luciferase family)
VLLGSAAGDLAMTAMAEWCDGWMPGGSTEWIAEGVTQLRRRWAEAGRSDPAPIVWAIQAITDSETAKRNFEALRDIGVEQVLLSFDSTEFDEVLPVLDRYSTFIRQ